VADAPAYRDCVASVARERKYLMTVDGFSLEQTREFLRNIESAGWPCVMATAGQRMIGWCDIMPKTVPGFTHGGTLGMGVLQEWRGQGIGRRLLGECLALGRTAELERIELAVYADNNRAIRLYESMGFVLEGRRSQVRKIDGQSQDELLMAFRYA
jgi:ribosomal protein S18 acetylase RimI-like enzyme